MNLYTILSASKLYDLAKEKTTATVDKIMNDPIGNLAIPLGEVVLIVLLCILGIRLSNGFIDRIFSIRVMDTSRAHTLQTLTKSIVHYALYFLLLFFLLIKMGFNPAPILAGAGILGLALGFGAQHLVKDFITGFFLIFERQLEVGDSVQINGQINGTVEEVGLRTTKIREYNQRLHYIPNGRITQVTNYNREKMRAIVHITVAFDSDLEKVIDTLAEVCKLMNERYDEILLGEADVSGMTNIHQHGIQFTITALTDPEQFSTVENDMRKETILHLRKNGIQFAYPLNIIHNTDKN